MDKVSVYVHANLVIHMSASDCAHGRNFANEFTYSCPVGSMCTGRRRSPAAQTLLEVEQLRWQVIGQISCTVKEEYESPPTFEIDPASVRSANIICASLCSSAANVRWRTRF
eukprot:SAG31_NODE_5572_length_2450_cov_1.395151_1_plen_111_part_10